LDAARDRGFTNRARRNGVTVWSPEEVVDWLTRT
jgi:hypothetical protein